jgi:hypothetical protein
MKRSRPPLRPARRRVFLGCEGDSERGYGVLIGTLLNDLRQDVHIDAVLLKPGGGEPLTLVERAKNAISERERRSNSVYEHRAIMLDSDLVGRHPARDEQAMRIADSLKIQLIWQNPCFEALLLRHLEGCDKLRPSTCAKANRLLLQQWPNYSKNMPATRLGQKILHDNVARAAAVDQELNGFLQAIGFFN